MVNAKMAGVDVYSQSGINPDTTDITTWSRASEFMQDELDEDSITLYTGRVDLKPYNLGNGDLAGLKLASLVTEIDLPTSITELQDGVFENMTDLKVVKMPAGVTKIGVNAFKRCLALIIILQKNSKVKIFIEIIYYFFLMIQNKFIF